MGKPRVSDIVRYLPQQHRAVIDALERRGLEDLAISDGLDLLGEVLVGDWFIRAHLPGRVTSLLHRDEERARITFSLDRESR